MVSHTETHTHIHTQQCEMKALKTIKNFAGALFQECAQEMWMSLWLFNCCGRGRDVAVTKLEMGNEVNARKMGEK